MAWLHISLEKLQSGEVILTDDDGDEIARVNGAHLERELRDLPGNMYEQVVKVPGVTHFTLEMIVTDDEKFRAALDG